MEFLRDWPVDHCGAAVLHGGSVSFEGDVDRLFGLASVTKPLVAYAVLIAVVTIRSFFSLLKNI